MSKKQSVYEERMQELINKSYGEFNIWEELNKRNMLDSLIKDSMPSLASGIVRIDLHDRQERKSVIVNFKSVGYLKEYRMKEKEIIETMRALYKERELKSKGLVFHKLEAKVLRVNVEEKCEKEDPIDYIEGTENFINHVDRNTNPTLWRIFEEIRVINLAKKEKYNEQKARGL
ncbi:hypothetical protein [Helicobacter trogontum]|uniref:Uncharacterized protein n=1 Tax=Helicobacter trogontum TaxID=50960 RepID=A0A099VDN2_9HELI|nr:hypothetical protein [Helicobacter trogontum]TLD81321.1 hypothetical protein LS81_008770 [Helicobacter trogontum]